VGRLLIFLKLRYRKEYQENSGEIFRKEPGIYQQIVKVHTEETQCKLLGVNK
jgi:hypothetical protein